MSKPVTVNKTNLANKLGHMRDINSNKNDHMETLKYLGYDAISMSPNKFDAILLKVIDDHFRGISKDIICMALGLMLGYEREIKIGKRREKYLEYSNFTKDFTRIKGDYSEADKDRQKKYKTSLINAETERIKKLAIHLAKIVEKGNFEEYTQDLTDYYDDVKDTIILKDPYYITIQPAYFSDPGSGGSESGGFIKKHIIRFILKLSLSVEPLAAVTVFMILITVILLVYNSKTSEKETSTAYKNTGERIVNNIEIVNRNIILAPGEDTYLDVKIMPSGLDSDELFYVSTNPTVIYLEGRNSRHVTAVKELPDNVNGYSKIVAADINGPAQDTATVTIKKPGQIESARNGKNGDDISSGDFKENVEFK